MSCSLKSRIQTNQTISIYMSNYTLFINKINDLQKQYYKSVICLIESIVRLWEDLFFYEHRQNPPTQERVLPDLV